MIFFHENVSLPRSVGLWWRLKVSVMRVLTLLLGHELDGQIDEVLRLAQAYDDDENSFRFRCQLLVTVRHSFCGVL